MEPARKQDPDPPPDKFFKKAFIKRKRKKKTKELVEEGFLLDKEIPPIDRPEAATSVDQPEEEPSNNLHYNDEEDTESYSHPSDYSDIKKEPPQFFPLLTDRQLIDHMYVRENHKKRKNDNNF